ncbi:uncharacterized protein ColSpa_03804 [Colletotrichum spaethianum]|uniref:Uncharacterized protein n=1 Tax=Colletotrichum spaethianum TaxID=700344 RepID=A0AA37LC64_9PEZI|nr:uncharacterized protein ColSpa_03804 [Colletotrichum spaethianum]GKT43623.1 hypothetical protein ColSpa_03804 [Colletotrichum spaethianum]
MFAATQRFWLSALAATTLLFTTSTSAAAVVQPRQGDIPVNDWITIDPNGNARTITPSVVTSNGALATISPPPYSLTGSVYTVTATTGGLTTSTGAPPPPKASNTLGYGGVFPVCNNKVGNDSPFCFPRRESTLHVESTYYIQKVTWDTTFFADAATPIVIVGFDVDNGITASAPAFSVTNLSGGDGWVPWTPRVTDLEERDSNNMTIILIYSDPETGEEMNRTGPVFTLRAALDTDPQARDRTFLLFSCPRHAAIAAAAERENASYATGQTRGMHGHKGSADIRLGPTSPPPGDSPGRNVFQDEVRRQERERK